MIRIYYYLLFVVILAFSGCQGVQVKKVHNIPPPFKPNVTAYEVNDSVRIILNYNIFNNTFKDKAAFVKNIKRITCSLKSKGTKFRTFEMRIDTLMVANQNNFNFVFLAVSNIFFPQRYPFDILSFEFNIIISDNVSYLLEKPYNDIIQTYNFDKKHAMDLIPVIEKLEPDNYFFGLAARRLNSVKEEYLPSSEDYRIDVYSRKGIEIFNTNFKKDYSLAIGHVQPEEPGKLFLYSYFWNIKNNNITKVTPGDYILKMSLPAKPSPYFISLDFKVE